MLSETNEPDPFAGYLDTRVVEATPVRAVVEQPDVPVLGNHVGVRHASALYAGGYEAARALVLAVLGETAPNSRIELAESTVTYDRVGMGPLTFVAEPDSDGWHSPRVYGTSVSGTDENGKAVMSLRALWRIRDEADQANSAA